MLAVGVSSSEELKTFKSHKLLTKNHLQNLEARVGIGPFPLRLHLDFPLFYGLFNSIRDYPV